MFQNNTNTPLLNRAQTASPSPARDALKGNLEAAAESTTSLKNKKSWFGSLRDVVQKGALQAKAAVDVFRGDQRKAEAKAEDEEQPDLEAGPRQSFDSTTKSIASSTTPLRGRHHHHHSLASRAATASLRRYLPSRRSGEMFHPAGPESFDGPLEQGDGATTTHTRKSSVAGSIVGSIRGMGRRAGLSKQASPPAKETSPERPAETVSLPSSPINIPSAAPALELDLGPGGFMAPAFGGSPGRQRTQNTLKLTDPANITTGIPKMEPVYLPVDTPGPSPESIITRPVTPSDLLNLPSNHFHFGPPPGPSTPMPGTNMGLEVDGANSEKSEKTQVFERSVTPSNDKERKELRTMRSLDAMAEACTIAHASDEIAQLSEPSITEHRDPKAGSPEPTPSPPLDVETSRRNAASAETIYSCPSDMPELTRQETWHDTVEYHTPFADPKTTSARASISDDPFHDRNAVGSGPPSPTRSVELPFRLKVTTEIAETAESPNTAEFVETAAFAEAAAAYVEGDGRQLQGEYIEYIDKSDTIRQSSPLSTADSRETRMQRDHAIAEGLIAVYRSDNPVDSPPPSDGMSPHPGPLVPQFFDRISNSQNSSPRSVRSRTTYTTGLGDAEYKFSFDNWLKESSTASAPDNDPTTPHRRRVDISLDSVSTNEERRTPQISPATTNPDRTPSMGNRLDFDLKRSQRNMRYNALHQARVGEHGNDPSSCRHWPPRFIVGASEETEATGIQLADFESAYANSREASPTKDEKILQARVASDDSVAESLKDAALNYSQLEEPLGEARSSGVDVFADPPETMRPIRDLEQQASTTNTEHPSPTKTESSEEFPMRAPAQTLSPRNFSPTFARDNSSPIRFTGLSVGHLTQSTTSPDSAGPLSSSSAASPTTFTGLQGKARVASSDTLDQSLQLFSSPESGYRADKSSLSPEDATTTASRNVPSRYRSKAKRRAGGSPLGEVSRNVT